MWLAHYESFWNARLDALGRYLYHEEEVEPMAQSTTHDKPSLGITRHYRGRAGESLAGVDRT